MSEISFHPASEAVVGSIEPGRGRGERRRRPWSRGRRGVIAASIAAVIAAGSVGSTFTPLFRARTIEVSGIERLSRERVRRLAGIDAADNVAHLDAGAARTALLAHPWIAHADVTRDLPGTVRIGIVERVPVVAVEGDGAGPTAIAADGTRLPGATVKGLPSVDASRGTDPGTAAAVVAAVPADVRSSITRVSTEVDGSLVLEVESGTTVRYGAADDLAAKGAALAALLTELDGRRDVESIDVTAPSAPAVIDRP